MGLVKAQGLTKLFRRPDKDPGLRGSLKHLVQRRFKDYPAVNGINLSIEAGEAVAYVGPNGAGKSTTIKLLAGILVPTSGAGRGRRGHAASRPDGQRPQHRCPVRTAHAAVVGSAGARVAGVLRDMYELSPAMS